MKRNKIILSSSILSTLFMGALAYAFTEIQKVGKNEKRIETIEHTQDNIEKKIDDIHWYLIRSKNGSKSNR